MSNVVKLAQPGFDVKTASDINLIFSSEWPLLKIVKSGRAVIYDNTNIQIIANHNLGYHPLFWVFSNNKYTDWNVPVGGTFTFDQISEYQGLYTNPDLYIDNNNLFFHQTSSFNIQGGVEMFYYLFDLDLNTEYSAPSIDVGSQTQARKASEIVFKIAKPSKSIDSADLEDYIIHSATRSPLVHNVKSAATSFNGSFFEAVTYHNLGYVPMFFGFQKGSTLHPDAHQGALSSDGGTGFKADEQTIRYQDSVAGRTYTVVTLKDPFSLDNIINVTV